MMSRRNTGKKEDWEVRKKQLLRSFFEDIAEMTPIPENKQVAPTPDHPPLPVEDSGSHSPLPDLIIEREPKRYLEDHTDEFYDKLEIKTTKYMARLERGEPSNYTSDISSTEEIENEGEKSSLLETTANLNKSEYDTIDEPNDAIQESSNGCMDDENNTKSEESLFEVSTFTVQAEIHAYDHDSVNGTKRIGNLNDEFFETFANEYTSEELENDDSATIISCTYTELVYDEKQPTNEIGNYENISIEPSDSNTNTLSSNQHSEGENQNILVESMAMEHESEDDEVEIAAQKSFGENSTEISMSARPSTVSENLQMRNLTFPPPPQQEVEENCDDKTIQADIQEGKTCNKRVAPRDYTNSERESKPPKRRRVQGKSVCTQNTDDINPTEPNIDWDELKDILGNPKSLKLCIICTSCKKCERKTLSTSNEVVNDNNQLSVEVEEEQNMSVKPMDCEKDTSSDTSCDIVDDEEQH